MPATTIYLVIAPGPVVRGVRKNRPFLNRDEAAIKLTITVPTDFFRTSIPEATVEVPAAAAIHPVVTVEGQDAPEESA
jgi:hypothetical protein